MPRYRKKPVVIEAVKFEYTGKGLKKLRSFCGDRLGEVIKEKGWGALAEAHICTLEDGKNKEVKHIATEGDYIIKGIKGEFYPCKPDIFKLTYEEVDKENGE